LVCVLAATIRSDHPKINGHYRNHLIFWNFYVT
jgi:hypothetical protein